MYGRTARAKPLLEFRIPSHVMAMLPVEGSVAACSSATPDSGHGVGSIPLRKASGHLFVAGGPFTCGLRILVSHGSP
jgi:hypothetical protein